MIKVLNIISDTNIGGAGRALLNYLAHSDRTEFVNSVIVPKGSKLTARIEALGVRAVEADIEADRSYSPRDTALLKKLIRAEAPDICHTHGSLTGRIAAKGCGVKTVVTRHSAFPFSKKITKTPLKLGYRFLYEHYADRIIAISPAGAELIYDLGVGRDKVETMMNGAEPLSRISDAEREKLRESFGVGKDTFLLGVLARIEEYKGHADMLRALSMLRAGGRDVKLLIAGTGGYEGEVKRLIAEAGLEECAIMAGFRSDVAAVLSAMDLQLNASYISETSSLSVIEGFSIALPAVCSRASGNPYLVNDGVSGLLFEPRNAADLAEKIERVMDSKELYASLSRGARAEYEARFTAERFAKDLEGIYKSVLEMRSDGK